MAAEPQEAQEEEKEKGLPWWVRASVIAVFGGLIGELVFPDNNILLIEFIVAMCVLTVLGLKQWGVGFAIFLGIVTFIIALLFGCNAVTTWGSNWGNSWPTPRAPDANQAWAIQYVGWPSAIYLFLIAAGYVSSWMTGAKGNWAVVITTVCSVLGAMLLGQVESWMVAVVFGLVGSLASLLVKFINKPAGGSAPMVLAGLSLVFGFAYLFISPMQAWVVLSFGLADPVIMVTAIAGYSAGAGIFSAMLSAIFPQDEEEKEGD